MKLNDQQIRDLINMIAQTRDQEASCGGCAQKLAAFAEVQLAGKTPDESMQAIEQHLQVCGECREEFEALQAALSANP